MRALVIGVLLAGGAAAPVAAQDTIPPGRPDSILVADSIRPGAAVPPESLEVSTSRRGFRTGRARQLFLGKHYRALWNTRLKAEVLDLGTFAGGLTPLREGGHAQTLSLRFRGGDGVNYAFRALDKEPTRTWPEELRGTYAARLAEDQMSALHPGAALVVAELLEAAGVLHVTPRLVWMPDDPRLGQYRARYGRMLGMIEERPSKGDTRVPGLAGADRVEDTEKLFEELSEGPQERVDARQLLAARLVDLFVGDWDRHHGQWVWARFDEGELHVWKPLPGDRDWALTRLDGLALSIARQVEPKHVSFGSEYGSVFGLTLSAQAIDRRLLSELTRETFDSVAINLQGRLTDSVIDAAVRRLPPELYTLNGTELAGDLKARRNGLPYVAAEFYKLLAGEVSVFGTNARDVVRAIRSDSGIALTVSAPGDSQPWFRRRFIAGETKEIRLYLLGGPDSVHISGRGSGGMRIRVVGGEGRDWVADSSTTSGTRVYDTRAGAEVSSVRGIALRQRPWTEYQVTDSTLIPPRDWGALWRYLPWVSSAPDVGFFAGASVTRFRYGFRQIPYASSVTLRGGYAAGASTFRAELDAQFKRTNSREALNLFLRASGLEIVRFHGFGNETPLAGNDAFYRAGQEQFIVAPSIAFPVGPTVVFSIGPVLKHASTDLDPTRFISTVQPYGSNSFGEVGAVAGLVFDSRDTTGATTRGVLAQLGGSVYPGIWDVASTFGEVRGEASTYLTARMPLRPTLALRAGAKKLFGTYPFFEAAFLGGASSVRGLREQRYAGDASVYANAELRLLLSRMVLIVPSNFGIFGVADGGRVFLEGEESSEVHTAFGGGVWISALSAANTVSLALVRGEDRTGFYLRAGFMY